MAPTIPRRRDPEIGHAQRAELERLLCRVIDETFARLEQRIEDRLDRAITRLERVEDRLDRRVRPYGDGRR